MIFPIAVGILDKEREIKREMAHNLFSDIFAWGYLVEAVALCVVDEAL